MAFPSDLDIASEWGSGLADTFVKIGVTALLAITMRLAWRRWREPLMMVVPLVLEQAASARSAGRLIAGRLDGLQSRQCSAIQSTGST